jgi:hypothetical protein
MAPNFHDLVTVGRLKVGDGVPAKSAVGIPVDPECDRARVFYLRIQDPR